MASKSLGTLTLDLVARTGGFVQGMSKAERESKKWRRQVQKDLDAVARTFKFAAAAAAAGLGAMVVQTVNSTRELKNFSALANTTTQDFQRMSYGARRFGIDQDKLADILKDVNDRVGDFVQTGGGPMADFFENIAPKVGVTADQFARLSGRDALQLYVDSLEKANLSQADMTFYMEAIASDATLLLPLLADSGAEMARLGEEAERTGNVLSQMEIAQLEAIKEGMDELTGAATGMKNQIVLSTLPAVEDLVDLLSDEQTLENAQALGNAVVTAMNWAVEAVSNVVGTVRFLADEVAAATQGVSADDVVRLERNAKKIRDILDGGFIAQGERLRFFGPTGLVEFWDDKELKAELAELEKAIADYYERASQPQFNAPEFPTVETGDDGAVRVIRTQEETAEAAKKTTDAIAEQIKALEFQAETLGKSADEITLLQLAADGATPAQLAMARAALETVAAYEKQQEMQRDAAAIIDSVKTATERLNDEQEKLDELFEAGLLSWDQYTAAMVNAKLAAQQSGKDMSEALRAIELAAQGFGRNFEDALIDAAKGGADAFSDMVDAILEDIARLTIRTQITQPLADSISTGIGNLFANANGNAFADGRVIPFASGGVVTGPTLFPMRGAIGLMGEAGPEAIMPLKRGSDGKLGVSAQGGGGVVVQIVDQRSSGEQPQVEQSRGPDGRQMIRVLIRDEMKTAIGSGALDRTFAQTYGMKRRGL